MVKQRVAQLEYSEFQSAMLDEAKRRRKAAKIIAVLEHFHGPLGGLTVGDVGCSAGFIADELAQAGAKHTLGIDIDVPGLRKAARPVRRAGGVRLRRRHGAAVPRRLDRRAWCSTTSTSTWSTPTRWWRRCAGCCPTTGCSTSWLGNRLGVMEPHYKLPFLSYLPPALARPLRAGVRAGRPLLRAVQDAARAAQDVAGLPRVGLHPARAGHADQVRGGRAVPRGGGEGGQHGAVADAARGAEAPAAGRADLPVVATKTPRRPAGARLPQPPERVRPL
ncbi:class I SAM-dependent methyltransferase [Nonomuraea rubra]|uniref:class I SAM-dependent methyltransferase n=1 Tax=Nonomuraea rubra TaxID=46180 RepID=UPI0031EBBCC4